VILEDPGVIEEYVNVQLRLRYIPILEKQGGRRAGDLESRILALWLQHTGLKPQSFYLTNKE